MFNVTKVRQDFPLLADATDNNKIIYLDNACQSLRPKQVISAITEYYSEYPACGGRSMHRLASKVTRKCDEARGAIANFIGAKKKEEIIFTRNTTEGINLVANSLGLKKGDVVITTDKEHNSNLIPWQVLKEKIGIVHKIVPSDVAGFLDTEEYRKMLKEGATLVSMGYTSNLDGVSIPAEEVVTLAHQIGAKVMLDGAQAVPHKKINVTKLDVDFLTFSGHKMLGPSGTGVLYGKRLLLDNLDPFLVGGDTVESSTYDSHKYLPVPEKFEAGLQDYAGILGLGEAVRYLSNIGFDAIQKQEQDLNTYITNEIIKNPRINILGPKDPSLRGGIISFTVENADVHQVALMLDSSSNIMVRSGQHCVHSWFNARNIKGSVRASLYFYNTMEEAEHFVKSINKVLRVI